MTVLIIKKYLVAPINDDNRVHYYLRSLFRVNFNEMPENFHGISNHNLKKLGTFYAKKNIFNSLHSTEKKVKL